MRNSPVAAIVGFCTRWPRPVIAIAVVLALASAAYATAHFAITTDTERLLPPDLPWREQQLAYTASFPEHQILAVVEAPTPELSEIAANRLAEAMQTQPERFSAVRRVPGGELLERSALLFLPQDRLAAMTRQLRANRSLIAALAADPSLRGAMAALTGSATAAQSHRIPAGALLRPMTMLSDTLEDVFADRFASFSWRAVMNANAPSTGPASAAGELIEIDPHLDFNALRPGRAALDAARETAAKIGLGTQFGARLRLTGRAPIDDAQFASLSRDALPGLGGAILAIIVILWLALRSVRIILAGFATLMAGFVVTAAAGLWLIGAFNVISIAFAVLFIGLGADFGIQFSVRYRAERHEQDEVRLALRGAAQKAGGPLALAAAGTAVGFLCFLPTDYRGVAELGEIAGVGMLIAFVMTITLLPALLCVLNPPSEPQPMRLIALAPIDGFLTRHRIAVVLGTIALVVAGSPLLLRVDFDFDPIHLQDPESDAVTTYHELSKIPELGVNAANVIVPSVRDVQVLGQRVEGFPEVAGVRSVENLVPADQQTKLTDLDRTAAALNAALYPAATRPAASDAERVEAIRVASTALRGLSEAGRGEGAAAISRLSRLLTRLADADPDMRDRAERALTVPLNHDLDRLRAMLRPLPITVGSLPPAIARDWVAPDGRARVEILPSGDQNDPETLRRFATAVLAAAPDATGRPVTLVQSERTVLRAFIEAGVLSVIAIALILWIALRRFGDVLLTLAPLLVAGLVTLELMVLSGQSMNFANVIALPLLLGVGVAFKIYYIMAWRAGRTNLLQSTLTRAVVFSALTTATAFGSLWLSNQPGMSSMGRLMALALICTMAAAVLFQPALMGPPRQRAVETPRRRFTPPAPHPVAAPPVAAAVRTRRRQHSDAA